MFFIKDKECTGCMACLNICPKKAIEIQKADDGFNFPKIDEDKCIKCNLCEKVCPVINRLEGNNKEIEVYAASNNDDSIRKESSSGGVFTLFATEILKENGVVFGAMFDEDLKLEHRAITNIEDLSCLRGSKYLQSKIKETYKEAKRYLNENRKVLFTGTPCQIGGLLSFLGKEYENLYTQDFVCHGVPSPKMWEKHKEYMEKNQNEKLKSVFFRDKSKEGWSKYNVRYNFEKTVKYVNNQTDSYMRMFLKDLNLRQSCYSCKFKEEKRNSDITVADYWGINEIDKEINDEKGLSAVLINSKKGKDLFEKISAKIKFKEMQIEGIKKYNPSIMKSVQYNEKREIFFEDLENKSMEELIKKYVEEC